MSEEIGLILVVDDNEMNRDMLSRRLQRQGHEVMMAENGSEALDMMQNNNFDLVLLDIMMPKLNGYQVLEQAKADDKLRHTPIIMISAVDELDSVVKCIELGAEDYLFKPFNPVLLKARVSATLEKNRLRGHAGGGGDSVQWELLALTAHELTAPLAQIQSAASDLKSIGILNSQQAEVSASIERTLQQVLEALADLAALAEAPDTTSPAEIRNLLKAKLEQVT